MFFLSGSTRPPYGGFDKNKKRVILYRTADDTRLPVAHTCFFQLDLPHYKSKETLKEKFLMALSSGKDFHNYVYIYN